MNKQSFCWHCGGKLKLPCFTEITDPIGNVHKIHKVCRDDAQQDMRAMPYEPEVYDLENKGSATCNYRG